MLFSVFTNLEIASESYSVKQGILLLLSISFENSFGLIFNKVNGWRLATLVKIRSFTDMFQEISLLVQNNYLLTPVCGAPLDRCFSCFSYSGVMPKKGTTKKYIVLSLDHTNLDDGCLSCSRWGISVVFIIKIQLYKC